MPRPQMAPCTRTAPAAPRLARRHLLLLVKAAEPSGGSDLSNAAKGGEIGQDTESGDNSADRR
jgi:hypothetical protein